MVFWIIFYFNLVDKWSSHYDSSLEMNSWYWGVIGVAWCQQNELGTEGSPQPHALLMPSALWPLTFHLAFLCVLTKDCHLFHLHLLPSPHSEWSWGSKATQTWSSLYWCRPASDCRLGLCSVSVFSLTHSSQFTIPPGFAPLASHPHLPSLWRRWGMRWDCLRIFPSSLSSYLRGGFSLHLQLPNMAEWVNKGITGGTSTMHVLSLQHPLWSGPHAQYDSCFRLWLAISSQTFKALKGRIWDKRRYSWPCGNEHSLCWWYSIEGDSLDIA